MHCCAIGQFTHATPPTPQRDFWFPGRHVLPSQHPAQVSGSHWQAPPTHFSPAEHARPTPQTHWPVAPQVFVNGVRHEVQALPPVPQVLVVDMRQVSPSQQPVAQFVALQLAVETQTPPSAEHVEPALHDAQLRPPTPQAVALVPAWQTPERQQPTQLAGPHGSMHA